MDLILIFATTLLLAVLVSHAANRSVISTAVLFLAAGFAAGEGWLGFAPLNPSGRLVEHMARAALFAVLFTDGMRLPLGDLAGSWRLPGRALFLGMPLTMLVTAAAAHWIVGLDLPQSLLVGAVLSPTDPVLAAAIVGREEISQTLRRLLNVESGLNDGLALPAVLGILTFMGVGHSSAMVLVLELLAGTALGVILPWAIHRIERSRWFATAGIYEPLLGSGFPWPQRLAASWFGPRGFASVVYGILVLHKNPAGAEQMFHLIAAVVATSIVAHSSSDVAVARWLETAEAKEMTSR